MKLNKYVGNYLKEQGITKFDFEIKNFLNACKKFSTEQLSDQDLITINNIVDKGTKRNFQEVVNHYFEKKYANTDVWNAIVKITEDGDYEYADNFRINDGSPLDEIIYYMVAFYGCCGSYDEETVINKVTYKIGFNYGH